MMAAGPYGGGDGIEIGPRLRVEQAGQLRHAVGALRSQAHEPSPSSVLVGERAVGVERVGDAFTEPGQQSRVHGAGVVGQRLLGVGDIVGGDAAGQRVQSPADHPQVVLADRPVGEGGRHGRQLRIQGGAEQGAPRMQPGPDAHAPNDLARRYVQPLPQVAAGGGARLFVRWGVDLGEHLVHQRPIRAFGGLQACGHLHAKCRADRVGRGGAQYRQGGVDRVEGGLDLLAGLLWGQHRGVGRIATHTLTVETASDNGFRARPAGCPPLCINTELGIPRLANPGSFRVVHRPVSRCSATATRL